MRAHHRCCLLAQHLSHIDFLEGQIAAFDRQIATSIEMLAPPAASPPAPGGWADLSAALYQSR